MELGALPQPSLTLPLTVSIHNNYGINTAFKKKHFSLATSCEYESSMLIAVLGGMLAVVIVTAIIVQVLVIAFFMRKLQAKGIYML